MKKIIITLLIIVAVLAGGFLGFYFYKQKAQQPQVKLYSQPTEKAPIVQQIKQDQKLIPIFQQKGWTKVGNPKDGQVGWVHTIMTVQTDQPNAKVNSTYVQEVTKPGKKPVTEITGYKNGKKLSKEEAKKLLKNVQAQRVQMQKQFDMQQEAMQKQFQLMQKQMNQMFMQTEKMFQ